MAKALTLSIKRPNGKTYEIPITPCQVYLQFDNSASKFTDKNIIIYEDLAMVWTLLELPIEYESGYGETWVINNVSIPVNFTFDTYASIKRYYVRIYKNLKYDLRIYAPLDSSQSYASTYLTEMRSRNSYFCYDYKSSRYFQILGAQAIEILNVSSEGYINLFKPQYYPEFFKHGYKLSTENNPSIGLAYANPTGMSTPKQDISMAECEHPIYINGTNPNQLDNFIRWLNSQPNVDKIPEPPKYPDNPDDPENPDDNPTDPIPGESDPSSDPVPIPPKPTIDVTGTGFVTLYNPSTIDIRNLAYFMWSGEFIDVIKKMFSAPFDCLIGLKLIYCPLTTGNNQTIWLGNVESNVSAPKITEQFIDFDCGTITLNGYYGSFLDYPPYTKISIFLPFIGYKQLNVDEVMNSTIHLVYRVDVYTGACIAFLQITKTILSTQLNSVLYQFDGNCAMDIPFTSNDMSRYIGAILNTAASTAMTLSTPNTGANEKQQNNINAKLSHNATSGIVNGALDVIQTKPTIARGGSLAGANASMGIKQPYIIIERPLQQMPNDYQNYIGIPLNMTKQLSQIQGFTILSKIFMASQTATENEIQMIENLLYEGVVF